MLDSMYLTLDHYKLTVLFFFFFTTLKISPRMLLFWWSLWQKFKDTICGGMLLKPQSPVRLCSQGREGGNFGVWKGVWLCQVWLIWWIRMNLLLSQARGKGFNLLCLFAIFFYIQKVWWEEYSIFTKLSFFLIIKLVPPHCKKFGKYRESRN